MGQMVNWDIYLSMTLYYPNIMEYTSIITKKMDDSGQYQGV